MGGFMRDPMLGDPEDLGPEEPQPPPKVCSKCNAISPCIGWDRHPYSLFDPFKKEFYECPVHGYFEISAAGVQSFDCPDTYVLGPNGERLFEM
jgi:hypothetical protein